jgi:hypothetical protein
MTKASSDLRQSLVQPVATLTVTPVRYLYEEFDVTYCQNDALTRCKKSDRYHSPLRCGGTMLRDAITLATSIQIVTACNSPLPLVFICIGLFDVSLRFSAILSWHSQVRVKDSNISKKKKARLQLISCVTITFFMRTLQFSRSGSWQSWARFQVIHVFATVVGEMMFCVYHVIVSREKVSA